MVAALFAVVLALAGAPAATPVTCSPTPLPSNGLTFSPWGVAQVDPAVTDYIVVYGPVGCAAAIYLAAGERERSELAALNPKVNWAFTLGVGLLLDLHEATHVGLHSVDECLVERTALAKLPELLASLPAALRAGAAEQGRLYDETMPASFHGC